MLRPRVSVSVDGPTRIATVRYVGAINGDAIVPEVLRLYGALERPWAYDCIWDMSRHTGHTETRDNEALARGWQAICGGRDLGRYTAIVSADALIGARLTLTQRLFPFRTLAVFAKIDAARAWLETARAETEAPSVA